MSELKEEKRRMCYQWFPRARSFDNPHVTNNYDAASTTSLKKEYSIGLLLPDDGFCSAAIGENISDEKITSHVVESLITPLSTRLRAARVTILIYTREHVVLLLPIRQQNSIGFPPTFPEEVGKNFESMAKICDTGYR